MGITRRQFCKFGAMGCLTILSPLPAFGHMARPISKARRLALYNVHTGEYLDAYFQTIGGYCEQTLEDINYLLRDRRTGEIKPIDLNLLALMHELSCRLKTDRPFHIISGYRSKSTNEYLRKRSQNVASKSLHLKGKAVDVRIPGLSLSRIHRAAVALKGGGVGHYPKSNFIHLDTGRVRYW